MSAMARALRGGRLILHCIGIDAQRKRWIFKFDDGLWKAHVALHVAVVPQGVAHFKATIIAWSIVPAFFLIGFAGLRAGRRV